jgi:poly(A) polymerase
VSRPRPHAGDRRRQNPHHANDRRPAHDQQPRHDSQDGPAPYREDENRREPARDDLDDHHDGHIQPRIIRREDHSISRKDIDRDTLRVLYALKDAGYESYLVGGAVRDLLIGRKPKDFDVATSARPRDLRRLFRNSREVGRRFRLVHVFFGPKNVEVATLRSAVEPSEGNNDLYVDDDNQWGDLESDAFRRDFTVNALFYDIRDFAVIDYTGGVADIERKLMRCIGDPQVRFREDPVRMLRAIKFAARFGFTFDPETDRALRELQGEILKASRFRVTEEIFRILTQPNRAAGLRMLGEFGFMGVLYPEWSVAVGEEGFDQVVEYFTAVDAAADEERYFPLEVLTAGLFIPLLDAIDLGHDQFNQVAARVTQEVRSLGNRMDLPKRLVNSAVEIMRGQLYLLFFAHLGKRVRRYVSAPFFDLVWRVHELAFGRMGELADLHETWLSARKALRTPIGGTVDTPDRRDIFSFRGKTGGGRHSQGRRERRHSRDAVLDEVLEGADDEGFDDDTIDREAKQWEEGDDEG